MIVFPTNVFIQQVLGFGGTISKAAILDFRKLSANSQTNLLRAYFSNDGSRYNLGRVLTGEKGFYSNTSLTVLKLLDEDVDSKAPFMKAAQSINDKLKFIGTAKMSPQWMKTFNNEIRPEKYQRWADFHIKLLEKYEKYNLHFWGITTGNRPSSGNTVLTDSVTWSPQDMGKWITKNLGPSLRNRFMNIKIITVDDTMESHFYDKIQHCINYFYSYLTAILKLKNM